MDYVVAGFGIGALLALAGFALWELFGNSEEPGRGWLTRAAIGLMIGSLVIWSVTAVSLLSIVDDSTGSHLVLLTTLVTLVAIAAGTFWYWRADQALLASLPPQQRVSRQKEVRPKAASAVPTAMVSDAELSDWDKWPEREQLTADSTEGGTAADVSFEPEVAAEVETLPSEETEEAEAVVAEPNEEAESEQPSKTESPADDGEPAQPEDAEIAAIESNDGTVEPLDHPEPEPIGEIEPSIESEDSVAALGEEPLPDEPEDSPAAPVGEPLPKNVRPLRPRPVVAAAKTETHVQPEELSAPGAEQEHVDEVVVEYPEPNDEAIEIDDNAKSVEAEDVAPPPAVAGPPAAFESSLLADIDVTATQSDGRYQSPLLADLEPDPDELEGVGLARWRSDARLTDEEPVETPSKKSRRRR